MIGLGGECADKGKQLKICSNMENMTNGSEGEQSVNPEERKSNTSENSELASSWTRD